MKKGSKLEIAQTYAQALYDASVAESSTAAVVKDLAVMSRTFTQTQALDLLNSPILNTQAKNETIAEMCKKLKISTTAQRFVQLLAEKRRLELLPLAADLFMHIYYDAHDIIEVTVESVQKLSDAQVKKLESGLQKILQRQIAVKYQINPQILGGLTVQYGYRLIDDSIKNKLQQLEQALKGNV